jgi:hypothetical protein
VSILDDSDRTRDREIVKVTGLSIARMTSELIGSGFCGGKIFAKSVQWIARRLFLRIAYLLFG